MSSRRVVVTGMGCISPLGNTVDEFWANALKGVSGASYNPGFEADLNKIPVNFSCQVKDFDFGLYGNAKQARRTDTFLLYALAASSLAVKDAGLSEGQFDPPRVGTLIGTGIGGLTTICAWHSRCEKARDYSRITPFFVPGVISNMAAGEVSIAHNFTGPSMSVSSACATGTHAIGESMRMIRDDLCDVMVCGGSEYVSMPLVVAGFANAKALSRRVDDPETASRPFDLDRDGFVLGEGAGILVLEEFEHARRRGANIYAECLGYCANADAYHITSPKPDGSGAMACMKGALENAGLRSDQIDYVNAHGTSTPMGDAIEVRAIRKVLGSRADEIPVNSTKSMTGHLLGASGSVEAIVCAKSLQSQQVHPTINVENQDPECNIDCVLGEARDVKLERVLSNSFGFGGTNASIVLGRI